MPSIANLRAPLVSIAIASAALCALLIFVYKNGKGAAPPAPRPASDAQAQSPTPATDLALEPIKANQWQALLAAAQASRSKPKAPVKKPAERKPSLKELEEWKQDISTDIGDTLMALVEECYELAGVDKEVDSEIELGFEVFGEPGVGTVVGSVELNAGDYGDELSECVRESAYAVRGSAPSMRLRDLWELTVKQDSGRRIYIWGGEPITVDGESEFMAP